MYKGIRFLSSLQVIQKGRCSNVIQVLKCQANHSKLTTYENYTNELSKKYLAVTKERLQFLKFDKTLFMITMQTIRVSVIVYSEEFKCPKASYKGQTPTSSLMLTTIQTKKLPPQQYNIFDWLEINHFLNQPMKQSLILVTHRLGIQACKEVRFPKINWSR